MNLRRRIVAAALLGVSVAPRLSVAQKPGVVYRIGVVGLSATAEIEGAKPRTPQVAMFIRAMREMGYLYGQHFVTLAYGVAGNPLQMSDIAAELVRQKPDVIVATGAAVGALKEATSTIPIVMTASLDPVGARLVPNLVRPGGNLTGMSLQATESTAKRLELLKDVLPAPAAVAVIWNQTSAQSAQAAERAARERGWRLVPLEIDEAKGWEASFHAAANARVGGVLVLAAQVLFPRAKRVAELTATLKLPAMYELRPYVDAGGLMCYGPDIVDIWRRAAGYVAKILDGAKPGDLPIEQPTRFELVINLPAARELGLKFPQRLLLRADEVIS
jgi:putative ABC transport system substrate-binding protein